MRIPLYLDQLKDKIKKNFQIKLIKQIKFKRYKKAIKLTKLISKNRNSLNY